jgi:hypothetical protein
LEELIKLLAFLQSIHEDTKANFLDKFDKDFKRYFFDDFTVGLLKRLTRERSRDDKVSLPSTHSIPKLALVVLGCHQFHT